MSGFNHQPFLWQQTSYDADFASVAFLSGFEGTVGTNIINDESSYNADITCLDWGVPWTERSYLTADWVKFGTTCMGVYEGGHVGFQLSGTRFNRPSGATMTYEGFVYAATRSNYTASPLILKINDAGGNEVFNLTAYGFTSTEYSARVGGFGAATNFFHTPVAGPFVFVQVLVGADNVLRVYFDETLKFSGAVGGWTGICPVWIGGTMDATPGSSTNPCVAYFDEWRITQNVLRPIAIPAAKFPRF